MKIGILTLSASNNCGSLLQCYALKRILEQYGDVEVINFSSKKSHLMYDLFPKGEFRRRGKRFFLRKMLFLNRLLEEQYGYYLFRSKYLDIKGKEFNIDNITEIKDKYDVIVVGSDQVWNVKMWDFDESFFAGWTNKKKIAYAPSLGGHDIRESAVWEQYSTWINQFSAISVREKTGKKCLETLTDKEVKLLLDPTLTIDPKEWENLVGPRIVKEDYIFYYSWAYCNEKLLSLVSHSASKGGTPVYVVDSRKWVCQDYKKWNFNLSKKQGPLAFLNLMYYAKRCYVESFHGLIFAFLFKKNVWLLDEHDKYEDMDARLKEIIELTRMQNRILTNKNVGSINQYENIDYREKNISAKMRSESLQYLSEALK